MALDVLEFVWHEGTALIRKSRKVIMARVTVEDCLEKVADRFSLAVAASKRTKQLMKGSVPLSRRKDNKFVVTALRELAEGKITLHERS
jgi:DNA-directed RNA polymerase subunit omega